MTARSIPSLQGSSGRPTSLAGGSSALVLRCASWRPRASRSLLARRLALPQVRGIVLRPQNIVLTAHTTPTSLPGTIRHCEFLGSQIRYLVECAGTEMVVDRPHRAGEQVFTPQTEVRLDINTADAVFLAAGQ